MEKTKTEASQLKPIRCHGNESAFPFMSASGIEYSEIGLTKREYFAAAAMLPIKAQPNEHGWFERWGNR